jgi:POT family proton-dependent oligopeptide transporter
MSNDPKPSSASNPDRFPVQARFIVGNEAAERFSYYGLVSILMVYITGELEKSQDQGAMIIHGFKFVNYFMPLLGGWISDRFLGRYNTILWISLAYCAGHATLAMGDFVGTIGGRTTCLYVGLALIAFGSGGIKPCVSAFLGDQFAANQGHLLRKAYAAFYWAINFGSFFSMALIPQIKEKSWAWAFGVPGIFMGLATLIFWLGRRHYVRIPPAIVTKRAGFFAVFFAALSNRNPAQKGFWSGALTKYSQEEVDAARSLGPIFSIFLFIPFFWSLFDQTHTTWVAQGEKMIPVTLLFGWKLDASSIQAINPLLVMGLVPLLTLGLYPVLGRLAAPLKRMCAGFFLAGGSFLIVAWLQTRIEAGAQLSILWQMVPYLVLTIGEVLLSTTGLEFAFREAAPSMKSTVMSFWNLTVAMGNLLVMGITHFMGNGHASSSVSPGRFMMYAVVTLIVAGIFSVICAFYRYRDQEAAKGH